MRYRILFLFLFPTLLHAQTRQGELSLSEDVSLRWKSELFIASQHKVETCRDTSGSYVCAIDGAVLYGLDRGMDLPRNQLTQLIVAIGHIRIELDVRNMFNISYDGTLHATQFKIQKEGAYIRLYGFFSDGAGTYTVHWRIENNMAIREVISDEERYFCWQE